MRSIFVTCLFSSFFQTTWTTADSSNINVVVARVNETVTLDCDATSGDHILWKKRVMPDYKLGDAIDQQSVRTFPIDASQEVTLKKRHRHVDNGVLNLGPVEWSDSGRYSCHSWKRDQISLKSWTIIVLDKAQNVSNLIFYEGIPLQVTTKVVYFDQPMHALHLFAWSKYTANKFRSLFFPFLSCKISVKLITKVVSLTQRTARLDRVHKIVATFGQSS